MQRLDFVADNRALYLPLTEPDLVEVPPMQYLMYSGQGAPENNANFLVATRVLYSMAYTIRSLGNHGEGPEDWQDFKLPPLEALWWMHHGVPFDARRRRSWRWTLMLRMPDCVTPSLVRKAIGELVARRRDDIYLNVRLQWLIEGRAVQVMHVGPYTATDDLAHMDAFIRANGLRYHGQHHEIYYDDPRRTPADQLRTVLRQPVIDSVP